MFLTYTGNIKSGVKIFNVTGSLSAPPSEDLLSYVDVSVNTSKVTKTLGVGAAIQKFEIIKYNGATVSPSKHITNLTNISLAPTYEDEITATCSTIYTVDSNYDTIYYPYTVRIYYYPDSYVGCTKYTLSNTTTTTLPDNTFMIFASASGTSVGQHPWIYPASGSTVIGNQTGRLMHIANTSSGLFAIRNTYSTTLYCYYWK